MPLGFQNITVITMQNITDLTNVSSYSALAINVNNMLYDGYLYIILLFVLWVILYLAAQGVENQPIANMMYSGAFVSIISLLLRGVYIANSGLTDGLLTDKLMWIFPVITILLAMTSWLLKRD